MVDGRRSLKVPIRCRAENNAIQMLVYLYVRTYKFIVANNLTYSSTRRKKKKKKKLYDATRTNEFICKVPIDLGENFIGWWTRLTLPVPSQEPYDVPGYQVYNLYRILNASNSYLFVHLHTCMFCSFYIVPLLPSRQYVELLIAVRASIYLLCTSLVRAWEKPPAGGEAPL